MFLLWRAQKIQRWLKVKPSRVFTYSDGSHMRSSITQLGNVRIPLADTIPKDMQNAFLCLEDQYYFFHAGVQPFALARAFLQNIASGKILSGASTIEMQLVRPLSRTQQSSLTSHKKKYGEKLVQILDGFLVGLFLSKQKILESHFSRAPFGRNYLGIQTAAYAFLKKPVGQLSLKEWVFLWSLPQRPARITELTSLQWNKLVDQKLDRMKQCRFFLKARHHQILASAKKQILRFRQPSLKQQEALFTQTLAREFPDKTNLKTTLELEVQKELQQSLQKNKNYYWSRGLKNIAMVVVDTHSGNLVGAKQNWDPSSLRDAQQFPTLHVRRSLGSTLKPMLMGQAIDERIAVPDTLLVDAPLRLGTYEPKNYSGTYQGLVSLKKAVHKSLNTPFVRLLDQVGVEAFRLLLSKAGIKHHRLAQHSLVVGGTEGSAIELAQLYLRLASGGRQSAIKTLRHIKDTPGHPLVSSAAEELVSETLRKNPLTPESLSKVAWKTGTSVGFRDAWSVGYGYGYVIVVWVGNLDYSIAHGGVGLNVAAPMMFDIFRSLKGRKQHPRNLPSMLGNIQVCAYSGLRPTEHCPLKKVRSPSGMPLKTACPYHSHSPKVHFDTELAAIYHRLGIPYGKNSAQKSFSIRYPKNQTYFADSGGGYKASILLSSEQKTSQCFWNGNRIESIENAATFLPGNHKIKCVSNSGKLATVEFQVEFF